MTNHRTITLISLAALVSLTLIAVSCQAKDAGQQQPQPVLPTHSSSLASKLLPKARSARSLSDMLEKVKSKLFGSRKQVTASSSSASSQIQPSASINVAQRQPWGDLNSFNQQYSPYNSLSASSYQWPSSASSGNQFMSQQYNPMSGFSQSGSSYPTLMGGQTQNGAGPLISSLDGSQSQPQQQSQQQSASSLNPAANSASSSGSNGGLLSSASHLIAQYLSPSSSQGSSASGASARQPGANGQLQPNGQSSQSLMSPQQQSQYQEFASILDSMVAQTGDSTQRQPSIGQYLSSGSQGQQGLQAGQQQAASPSYQVGSTGNLMSSGSMVGDTEMSGSSNIQSYMPAASPQQASQKSSMVGLAEQLAPGAQFNKLVSFPFSLSNNDDPNKEGRYKLHIPFLNQHVKRSDQQQQSSSAAAAANQQRQQQQNLNSYYQQLQQYASMANQGQQQMMTQASQVVPTIVSPQSSVSQPTSGVSAGVQSSPVASSAVSSGAVAPSSSSSVLSSVSVAQSNSAVPSSSQSQSSTSMLSPSSPNNPSASSSAVSSGQTNSRPAWSVADLQSSSSSSKLIPMPSASSSSSVDTAASSQN